MARTLRRERRFTAPLRTAALDVLAGVLPRSEARLLAVAIMSNHLHLVVQQGEPPLSALMQPLLRRLARLLQQAHALDGPVFWRHYASLPCLHPEHARNAIAYTHLNPVRAGLCDDPSDYPWTSHAFFIDVQPAGIAPVLEPLARWVDPSLALPLFARGPDRSLALLRGDYRAFLAARLAGSADDDDPFENGGKAASNPLSDWPRPSWSPALSPLYRGPGGIVSSGFVPAPRAPDLGTIARGILTCEAPGVDLNSLRGRGGGRESSRLRRLLIVRLHAAGARNVAIARLLGLSESAVSWVVCRYQREGCSASG